MTTLMQIFSPLDILALVIFVTTWLGYEIFGERAAERGANLSGLMQGWRDDWTAAAVHRDNRIIDIQILRSLAGNSAFLASTAIFVIGGLAAMIGGSEHAVLILNGFEYLLETTRDRFGLMVGALIVVFINAFFRLAWSLRLHNNAAVVLGSIPQPGASDDPEVAQDRARVVARITTLAARHYNGGMHAYYFGLAACAWFLHPVALIAASLWVVAILYRREFRSRAHAALARK
ncbi:DUF599 domain-containing protein [Thalassobaculum salexigens]|uniref:DUF599 domain-containing protein n=1 Tax=Thalassobaculum salexigens TaxID=455360 RepID=UPI00041B7092|nr:DUF599 domain-containing protein [Thalassobaculum salexigens]